jgi:hypothetical protein
LQQMGGMTEAADYLDAVRRLSLMVYRSVWARVKQFWKEERWIRVTDNEMNVRFVGINKPVTMIQALAKQAGISKDNLQEQPPEVQQRLQMFAMDPRAQQVVSTENAVSELDIDIIIDEGIDTPTIQAEQFDVVAKMLPGAPPNLQPILWEALLANSAFKDKEKALEALRQPNPMAEQQAQMQAIGAQAEIEKTQSETALNMAKTEDTKAGTMVNALQTGLQMGMAA